MFITILDKKIHYEVKGEGKPILFVHGWGGSINSLKGISDLAAQKYKSIILDLPGFGQSDNPDKDWGVGEYAEILITLIDVLKIDKINYFGHSFGGSLGIYLASHRPTIINKLILCSSAYKRTGKTSKTAKSMKKIFNSLPFVRIFESQIKKLVYRIFFPDSDLTKFPHLENNFRKIMNEDLTNYLDKINSPTLILWGKQDTDTPLAYAKELKQKIQKSKLIIFPETSHSLPLKKPLEVFQEINKFI